MTMKEKAFPATKGWKVDLCDLAFMCDITEHLHYLNIKLHECKHQSTDTCMHDAKPLDQNCICGRTKYSREFMPTFQPVSLWQTCWPLHSQTEMHRNTGGTYSRIWQEIGQVWEEEIQVWAVYKSILSFDSTPDHLQLKLKAKFDSVGAGKFAPFIQNLMPQLIRLPMSWACSGASTCVRKYFRW